MSVSQYRIIEMNGSIKVLKVSPPGAFLVYWEALFKAYGEHFLFQKGQKYIML